MGTWGLHRVYLHVLSMDMVIPEWDLPRINLPPPPELIVQNITCIICLSHHSHTCSALIFRFRPMIMLVQPSLRLQHFPFTPLLCALCTLVLLKKPTRYLPQQCDGFVIGVATIVQNKGSTVNDCWNRGKQFTMIPAAITQATPLATICEL